MIRKEKVIYGENLRGGNGKVEMRHIVTEEELLGHGKLYARVILPPHASIGYHQHVGNTEPYLILRGKGIFTDNDGSRTEVGPGDVCVIEVGQSHGIENNSDEEELEFIGLIYNEEVK
ncbi:MAG: cupin domain-containing protein [Clostridiaceae bacterium]